MIDLGTPLVTIIMPIRNEQYYIETSLTSVLSQVYPPDRLEVLIVDGMSDDETRRTIADVVAREQSGIQVSVLNNPNKIVPTALNIGLRTASGSIVIRVDGHCRIGRDYVRKCIDALNLSGADCAGGAIRTLGESATARAISRAQSSTFGVGGVAFRKGVDKGRFVQTLAFGAYRREVFDRIGGFDEELVRNQDDEFNYRLLQEGGSIWMDPSIDVVYYSRSSLRALWRQYFQYGLYKVRVIQKRRNVPSWRHLIPAVFVTGLTASLLVFVLTGNAIPLAVVAVPYGIANVCASLAAAMGDWRMVPILPLTFLALHLAYGCGFLVGLWKWRKGWRGSGKIPLATLSK